jgi:hypothetical protein
MVVSAGGKGLAWLAETIARGLDAALRDGRATSDELAQLPLSVYAAEDDGKELDLTDLEKAEFRAVFERRSGRNWKFRGEDS